MHANKKFRERKNEKNKKKITKTAKHNKTKENKNREDKIKEESRYIMFIKKKLVFKFIIFNKKI